MANGESWKDVFLNRQLDYEAEMQSWTPADKLNSERILADAARLKEDPNALTPEKTVELLAHMKRNNMSDEFDDLVKTLRPSRKARLKAGAQGLLDNWLALGFVNDKTYATNPHTEKDKATGQVLGSAALLGLGHPVGWLMGQGGIGMKLFKADKAAKAAKAAEKVTKAAKSTKVAKAALNAKKATKVAKVATWPITANAIAKAASMIGPVNAASGVAAVGKSIKPAVGLATGKYVDPWNEYKLRDAINDIADPFTYSGQFINQ